MNGQIGLPVEVIAGCPSPSASATPPLAAVLRQPPRPSASKGRADHDHGGTPTRTIRQSRDEPPRVLSRRPSLSPICARHRQLSAVPLDGGTRGRGERDTIERWTNARVEDAGPSSDAEHGNREQSRPRARRHG